MGSTKRVCDCDCIRMIRPNILSLDKFRTERSETGHVPHTFLADLNENAMGPSLAPESMLWACQEVAMPTALFANDPWQEREAFSRYPDLNHVELKQAFCDFRNQRNGALEPLEPSNICVSSGLDDMIDLIVRCMCRPGQDRILICPPVYHMYQTSATINDIETVAIPLDSHNRFQLRLPEIQKTLRSDPSIKICFVCNPGNPTGFGIPVRDIQTLLDDPVWQGILVVDEAYIDFASTTQSVIGLVNRYPRLVVLQTLSKAFGLASIRVGFGVACAHLCAVLNNVKKPYSVSSQSIAVAKAALTEQSLALLRVKLRSICEERTRLARALGRIRGIAIRGGMDTNFVLFEVCRLGSASGEVSGRPCNVSAAGLVSLLRESAGILVRFKGMEYGCEGCVRVSVGNGEENERFVEQVRLLMQFLERAM